MSSHALDNDQRYTNEAKQAKKGKDTVPDSAIFEKIGKIREEVANHIYLQITATPQSLLLQSLGHPCSPAFCAALPEPGESYMGGDLLVTYYGRDPKQKVMDTVHQHARMFGYRQELKDVTRLFLPQHILEDFRAIHEADEGMRQAIGYDLSNIQLKPVWVGRKLKPTRSNVLNPAEIDAFTPGTAIFPPDPLWKASEIKQHTEALNKLLERYSDEDKLYEVNFDFLVEILSHLPSRPAGNYPWEDKRVQEALKAMQNEAGMQQGRLNVRRGKETKGKGFKIVNRPAKDGSGTWRGTSGFASPEWVRKAKQDNSDVPTLIVMLQQGRKEDDWDDQPFYLPTLILPKNKFVFMFNYSDEHEELENNLDLEDKQKSE